MKHLLSLVAALSATAALLLTLPGAAKANSVATTIPNPSGHLTCTGTNSDGSAAAWTVGGNIYYTSNYNNPPSDLYDPTGQYYLGFHNIVPSNSGNPYDGSGGASCTCEVDTLSNVQSGCAEITGDVNIYFTLSPYATGWGAPSSPQYVGSYYIPTPSSNGIYTRDKPLNFTELDNVNQVQYKVTSIQSGHTLGEVATTNL